MTAIDDVIIIGSRPAGYTAALYAEILTAAGRVELMLVSGAR